VLELHTNGTANCLPAMNKEGEISGGKSNASYHKRLHFQRLAAAGLSANSTLCRRRHHSRIQKKSARERLLQGAGGSAAAPWQSSAMVMMIAIQ
jgi:hypothetical protein